MASRITILQGHPDPQTNHSGHARAAVYAKGAREAGREAKLITVAGLQFPLLRTKQDFDGEALPGAIREAQNVIQWAKHLVKIIPCGSRCLTMPDARNGSRRCVRSTAQARRGRI